MIFRYLNKVKTGVIDVSYYDLNPNVSKVKRLLEVAFYSVVSFSLPFFLSHPQILLGSAVNMMLALGSVYSRGKELIPIIIFPSLGVLTKGVLLGPFTLFILYMIPFIWLGNGIYVISMKLFYLKFRFNYFVSVIFSAVFKASFLFFSAFILFNFSLVPSLFLTVFGIMQIITGIAGGFIAYPVIKVRTGNIHEKT